MSTPQIIKAFNHVKRFHPTVSIIIFDINGLWLYMDENFKPFVFSEKVDVGILEDASDSVPSLPYIYQHQN